LGGRGISFVQAKFTRSIGPRRAKRTAKPARLGVYFGMTYVVFCWGANTVAMKHAIGDIDPLAFTGLRFLLMAPLALVLAKASGQPVRFERRDLLPLLACGACGYGVYQYLWIIGLSRTTPFAAALFASLTPILTLGLVGVLRYERVRPGRWLGMALALIGVAVFEGAFSGRAGMRMGDALTLLSAAVFAVYNVVSAKLLDRYTPISLLAITMAIGALIILPGALPRIAHVNFGAIPRIDWAIYAYAVLSHILLSYLTSSYRLDRIPKSH